MINEEKLEVTKLELSFDNVNLKCEGYSMEDIISLIKRINGKNEIANKATEKPIKVSEVEEVDVRELGNTVRMPKTSNNFRCPSCGQAAIAYHQPHLGEFSLLVRDVTSDTPATYKANVLELPKLNSENFISVYKDLLNLLGEKVTLVEDSKDVCGCPCCLEDNTISLWIKAYDEPLDIFEISDICDLCGYEGSAVVTQTGSYMECENNCFKKLNE